MSFRLATLNLEQDHKRWHLRRELIVDQWARLRPDFFALNEIHIPAQTGRWLQRAARIRLDLAYHLVQQSKAGEDSGTQGEGLLALNPPIETANLDYRSHDCVALVARFEMDRRLLDVYVTHLIAARVGESARQYQVEQLLTWVQKRNDADAAVVCGDFNAAPDTPSIQRMAEVFQATQFAPTAFTPLREADGAPTHPEWPRFDRCIDYIWLRGAITAQATGLCFDQPSADDPTLWPSDHVGVWVDLALD